MPAEQIIYDREGKILFFFNHIAQIHHHYETYKGVFQALHLKWADDTEQVKQRY